MTPTQRTLKELRSLGFTCHIVERWNPFCKRRQDMIGCIDILAWQPGIGLLGVQATSGTNHSARVIKSKDEPRLKGWLEAGGRFEVWSWAKKGPRGERKTWQLRREEITIDQLN